MSSAVPLQYFGLAVPLPRHSYFRQLHDSLPDPLIYWLDVICQRALRPPLTMWTLSSLSTLSWNLLSHYSVLFFLKYLSIIDVLYLYSYIVWITPSECKLNEDRDFIYFVPCYISSSWNSIWHAVWCSINTCEMTDLLTDWIGIYYEPNTGLGTMGLAEIKTDVVPASVTYTWLVTCILIFSNI